MTRVHDSRTSRRARGGGVALALAVLTAGALAGCAARRSRPRALRVIDAREAALVAVDLLQSKGVTHAVVCRTIAVQAPVGAFLVDAIGELVPGSERYSLFRIGVRDGSDGPQLPAGSELIFIAKGVDATGRAVWIPPPGPDDASAGFVEAYEFLYDRAEFEQVPRRCAH
jgi:hypothetical protein